MANQTEGKSLSMQDLLKMIEEQKAKIEALEAAQTSRPSIGAKITPDNPNSKIVRTDHPEKNGGYIVKMPRDWSGMRMGINFRMGIGIIDEALPNCDEIAHWMEADFGYQILSATEDELNQTRRMLEGVQIREQPKTAAEKLMHVGQA